jgi:hypothetical protein
MRPGGRTHAKALVLVAVALLALGAGMTARAESSDQELAARMNLRISDFDGGWTRSPGPGGLDPAPDCNPAGAVPSAESFSAIFDDPLHGVAQASDVVDVYPDIASANREFGYFVGAFVDCYAAAWGKVWSAQASISRTRFQPDCGAPAPCDYSVSAHIRLTSTVRANNGSGPPVLAINDFVVAQRGRAVVRFVFSGSDFSNLPASSRFNLDEPRLVQAAMARGYDGVPTKGSWAGAANAICATANLQISQLPAETSLPVVVADARAIIRIAAQAHEQIAAIPRPPAEAAVISALLANDDKGHTLMVKQLTALGNPRPTRSVGAGYTRAGKELETLGSTYNAMARSLGARVCAFNPSPGGAGTIH